MSRKKKIRFVEKPKQQTQDFERHPGWAHSDIKVLEPVLLLLLLFPKPVAGGLQTGPLGRLQKNRLAPLFTAFRRGSLHPAIWQTSFSARPHTTIALRSQPRKIGFVEASPFVWHPPRCWADACPTERLQLNRKILQQDVNLQLHNIRSDVSNLIFRQKQKQECE